MEERDRERNQLGGVVRGEGDGAGEKRRRLPSSERSFTVWESLPSILGMVLGARLGRFHRGAQSLEGTELEPFQVRRWLRESPFNVHDYLTQPQNGEF